MNSFLSSLRRLAAFALLLCALASPARANDMSIGKVTNTYSGGKKFIDLVVTTVAKEKIDPAQIQLVVHFYVRNTQGAIVTVPGDAVSRWLTPPVDWAAGPETLQLECPVVKGAGFYGVVMGIYYKGKIQASYLYPGSLSDNLPDTIPVVR
ncbi:hypothetical protein BH09VER1_BH09VER1_43460 [soil metagenome]